jgi:hypothetical protein
MEEQAVAEQDVHKAKESFRTELARARKQSLDLEDPEKQAELADLPPHLQGRR